MAQIDAQKQSNADIEWAAHVEPPAPVLIGPRPPEKPLSLLKVLQMMKDNPLAAIPRAAYEQPVWEGKWWFGQPLLVSDPAGIKQVLLDNVENYPKAALDVRVLSTAFGDGILVSDGDRWRTHRRTMSPSFDHRSIAFYAPAMVEAAEARLRTWDLLGGGATVDIWAEMTALTREIILRTMFSADASSLGTELDRSLRNGFRHLNFSLFDMMPLIGPILMKRKLDRVRSGFEVLDAAMQTLIEARGRRTGAPPRDLLDRLITAADSETGARMTDEEVRDEVIIIFLAGHDTSALTATYVWYLLSQHPHAEQKLHAELASVLGGQAPALADLDKLPYTRMVIEESMRLYPPAPALTGRVAREPDEICGHSVPKGTEIAIVPWVLHRHRTLWENPDRFDPERFSPARSAGRARFAYLPFGGGPRICIGAALAVSEVSLLLATMAQRYRLRLIPGQDVVLQHRITLRPRSGIQMVLERRD